MFESDGEPGEASTLKLMVYDREKHCKWHCHWWVAERVKAYKSISR